MHAAEAVKVMGLNLAYVAVVHDARRDQPGVDQVL
jgi:hypothetical protein